jgi:hypothetical protein
VTGIQRVARDAEGCRCYELGVADRLRITLIIPALPALPRELEYVVDAL